MSWFGKTGRPIRNTTGYGVSGSFFGLGLGHAATRPNANGIHQSVGLPPKNCLSAFLPDPRKPGSLNVEMAKDQLARTKETIRITSAPVTARTQGRATKFLKSSANLAGILVGIGRGPAPPEAIPQWKRPDVPLVEIKTKTRWPLPETRAQAELRRKLDDKANAYLVTQKLPLRIATDQRIALEAQTDHVESVHQSMLAAVVQARSDLEKVSSEHDEELAKHRTATNQVKTTGEVLASLEAEKANLIAQQRLIATRIKACTSTVLNLGKLQDALPLAPHDHQVREAVEAYDRCALTLNRVRLNLQESEQSLTQAREKLGQAKQQMRNAPRFSKERATCGAEVLKCRKKRNEARQQVDYERGLLERAKSAVKISGEHATDLESRKRGFSQSTISSQMQTVAKELEEANANNKTVGDSLGECLRKLPAAIKAHEEAKDAEVNHRLTVELLARAVTTARDRAEGLSLEMGSIDPLKQALAENVVSASAGAKALQAEEALRSAARIDNMVHSPPGFERGQITDELTGRMRTLVDKHLHAVPGDLNVEEAESYRRDRIPDEQALEIVSRCLAHATEGNAVDAIEALDHLMGREFAGLVPTDGRNFKGEEMSHGDPKDDIAPAKRFAALMAARPSGVELLMRTAKPALTKPSRQLQDAVNVYFRATTALKPENRPEHEPSKKWLESAEQAAKILVHGKSDKSGPIETFTPVAMEELSLDHRVAFNGVRNGYLSIEKGSDYDLANESLSILAKQWVERAKKEATDTSPLHSRQLASKVGSEVGLPTLENNLSLALGIACEELLKKSGSQLLLARAHAAKDRVSGDPASAVPQVPRALLEAHSLLQRIQERAQKGEHLYSMRLRWNDWSAINKKVKELEQVEAARVIGTNGTRGGDTFEKRNHLLEKVPKVQPSDEFREKTKLAPPLDANRFSIGSLKEKLGKSPRMVQVLEYLNQLLVDGKAAASNTALSSPSPKPQQSSTWTPSLDTVVEGDEEEESVSVGPETLSKSPSSDEVLDGPTKHETQERYRGWQERINEVNWNDRLKPAGDERAADSQASVSGLVEPQTRIKSPSSDEVLVRPTNREAPKVYRGWRELINDVDWNKKLSPAGDERSMDSQADPIDQESLSLKQRLANLRVSGDGVANFQSVPLDQRLGELNAERIRAKLTGALERARARIDGSTQQLAWEPGLAHIEASLVGTKSGDKDQSLAQSNATNIGVTDDTSEALKADLANALEQATAVLTEIAGQRSLEQRPENTKASRGTPQEHDPNIDVLENGKASNTSDVPPTALSKALELAKKLQTVTDNFASNDGKFSEEELAQWLSGIVDGAFGSVAFDQGHQYTVGTAGLLGLFLQLATKLGLVMRPDILYSDGKNSQLKVGRDSLGTELSIGEQTIRTGTLGLSNNVAFSATGGNSPNGFALGPVAVLTHSITSVNTTSGVVMRNPKFDGKTTEDLTVDFREMVGTTLKWGSLENNEEEPKRYNGPMEALLDRHSAISIATVEKSKSVTTGGTLFAGAFAGKIADTGKLSGFGGAGGGVVSHRARQRIEFKTNNGTQGYAGSVDDRTHTTQADAFAGIRVGYLDPESRFERLAGIRQTVAGFNSTLDIRKSSAASGTTTVRFPDGSVVADRYVEYSRYDKLEAAVNRHREKWIQAGIKAADKAGTWPESYSESDKRIVSEATLNEFMANAKESLKYRTVTLNENFDVKPEVCALLTANLALEELAHLEERMDDVAALRAARDKLLEDESTYQPFFIKAYVHSDISHKGLLVLPFGGQVTKGSSAKKVFDWFPRVDSREALFKSLSKSQVDSSSPAQGGSRSEATKPAEVQLDGNGSQAANPRSSRAGSPPPNRPTMTRMGGTLNLVNKESSAANAPAANSRGVAVSSANAPVSQNLSVGRSKASARTHQSLSSVGLRPVPNHPNLLRGTAPGDGDCLFHSVIEVAGPVLADHLGCEVSALTPDMVRKHVGEHVIRVLSNDGTDPSLNHLNELKVAYGPSFNMDWPTGPNGETGEDGKPPELGDETGRVRVSDSARSAFDKLSENQRQHVATVLTTGRFSGIASELMPRLLADAFPGLKLVVYDNRDPGPEPREDKTFYRAPAAVVGSPQRTLPDFNVYRSGTHYDPAYLKNGSENGFRYERVEI